MGDTVRHICILKLVYPCLTCCGNLTSNMYKLKLVNTFTERELVNNRTVACDHKAKFRLKHFFLISIQFKLLLRYIIIQNVIKNPLSNIAKLVHQHDFINVAV